MDNNFLLLGGGFKNKGAQLLLCSIINEIDKRFQNSNIAVSRTIGKEDQISSFEKLKKLDINIPHFGAGFQNRSINQLQNVFLKFLNRYKDNFSFKDINAILDISGFAYGDKWGINSLQNLNFFLRKIKLPNQKYIMMPQAFGPFKKIKHAHLFEESLNLVDLILTRDRISHENIINLNINKEIVFQFPDITLTYGIVSNEKQNFCLIIPSSRLLEEDSVLWKDNYFNILTQIVEVILKETTLDIIILPHDMHKDDINLCQRLDSHFPQENRVNLRYEKNPIKIKTMISRSLLVVASRFHALASSLSQNIPSIALGWSHKYSMLYEDYGVNEFSFEEPSPQIFSALRRLFSDLERKKIIQNLLIKNSEIINQNELMWKIIKDKIED